MRINGLVEDCLVIIFRRFSLRELIRLRIVCGRWLAIIEIVGREKKTLKLFGSFRDVDDYCRALLQYNLEEDDYFKLSTRCINDEIIGIGVNTKLAQTNLNESNPNKRVKSTHQNASFNFLAHLFPNIKKLIICDRYQDLSTFGVYGTTWKTQVKLDLKYLLNEWPDLTDLSLFMFPTEKVLLSLCTSQLKSLKRFEIFKTNRYFSPGSDDFVGVANTLNVLSSSIWSQLEHVSFGTSATDMVYIFPRFGPNLKCLNLYQCSYSNLTNLYNLNSEICSKLTHLTINSTDSNKSKELEFVCKNFKSLQFLCLMPRYLISFDSVIENIAQLNLSELRICFYADYNSRQTDSTRSSSISADVLKRYKLNSIKRLQLKNSGIIRNTNFQFSSWIPNLFPMLDHLSISEQCTKTSFKKMQTSHKAFKRFLSTSKKDRPQSDLYWISLEDDLTRLIDPYKRLYTDFKADRKTTNPPFRRRNYHYRDYNNYYNYHEDSDNDEEDEDEDDHDIEDDEEPFEDGSDNSDVELIVQYPVDDNGVILLD